MIQVEVSLEKKKGRDFLLPALSLGEELYRVT